MEKNLKHVLIARPGDRETLIEFIAALNKKQPNELVKAYNEALEIGIVGSQAQGLYYYALHRTFEKVFGKSPITLEDNIILSLTKPIVQKGKTWEYFDYTEPPISFVQKIMRRLFRK